MKLLITGGSSYLSCPIIDSTSAVATGELMRFTIQGPPGRGDGRAAGVQRERRAPGSAAAPLLAIQHGRSHLLLRVPGGGLRGYWDLAASFSFSLDISQLCSKCGLEFGKLLGQCCGSGRVSVRIRILK
jgi:hypothetical protein